MGKTKSAYQIIPMPDFTLGPDASFKGRTRRQVVSVCASAPGQAHRFSLPLVEFVYTEWGGVSITKYRNNLTCTQNRPALNSEGMNRPGWLLIYCSKA